MHEHDVCLTPGTESGCSRLNWSRDNLVWPDMPEPQSNTAAYMDTQSDSTQSDQEYMDANHYHQQASRVGLNRSKTVHCDNMRTASSNGRPKDRFNARLSGINENTALCSNQKERFSHTSSTALKDQRRYLNQCITTAVSDNPECSQVSPALNRNAKIVDRQPWKSLGRRLSLGFGSNRPRTRQRVQAQHAAKGTNTSLIMAHSEGLWQSTPKQHSSWLDTIRMRLRGRRHRQSPDAVPIAAHIDTDFDEPIEEYEDTEAAIVDTPAPVPAPCYPRLRSQPSLCGSQADTMDGTSPSRARDEAVFVPDIDNIPLAHSHMSMPQRQSYVSQQPLKARFMLPHRHSIASSTQYSSLD
ncbi:hypothetical protein H4R24_004007 [Coemansia sp. RSA 988]|nr:hypothetical protein H4R24_004007 [Coemansia sp. RSA 988]